MPADTSSLVHRGNVRGRGECGPARELRSEHSGLPALAELRLTARALEGQWPVSEDMKAKALAMAMTILDAAQPTPAQIIAAGKLLILADMVNVRRERNATEAAAPVTINVFGDVNAYAGAFGGSDDPPELQVKAPQDLPPIGPGGPVSPAVQPPPP
jgi:hypothetical protein